MNGAARSQPRCERAPGLADSPETRCPIRIHLRPNRLRRFFEGDLSRTLALGMIATFVCVLLIGWNLWGPHQTFQHASTFSRSNLHRLIVSLTRTRSTSRRSANVAELVRRALDAYLERGPRFLPGAHGNRDRTLDSSRGAVLLVMWAVVIQDPSAATSRSGPPNSPSGARSKTNWNTPRDSRA